MVITEIKQVTENKKVTVGYKCNHCGKIHNGSDIPDDWHEFNSHHNSWGNDSVDSYEYYLACSPKCYAKLLKEAVDEYSGCDYDEVEISGFSLEFAKQLSESLNSRLHDYIEGEITIIKK